MAAIGEIELLDDEGDRTVGGALLIADQPSDHHLIEVSEDWEVELSPENSYVVARGQSKLTQQEVLPKAHQSIQKALDILSVQNDLHTRVGNTDTNQILWWEEDDTRKLRFVGISGLAIEVSASATVIDEEGNEVERENPPTVWHESQRFFRLAQNTDDLFDAYRNLFLALELLLSDRYPIKPHERESDWLKRSLRKLHSDIGIANYADDQSDPVESFYQSQYVDIRCEMFHSKMQRDRLLPHNVNDREKVKNAIGDLGRLVIDTMKDTINVNRSSGGWTEAGFERITGWMKSDDGSKILVSGDNSPLDTSESIDDTAWGDTHSVQTDFAEEFSKPNMNAVIGKHNVTSDTFPELIHRCGLVNCNEDNEILVSVNQIIDGLSIQGLDLLEVILGIRMRNMNKVKTEYMI